MLAQRNILLVDDEEVVCRGCQRIFEEEGYTVQMALSGKEGLEKAHKERFDVIITDLKMPDMSGLDVIKDIKQNQPDVPVIMITGYASVQTAVEATKIGADDYIPKPFNPDEIIEAVENVTNKTLKFPVKDIEKSVREKIIEKEQVIKVLDRASKDTEFWSELMENGSNALKDYRLSSEAKAAIVSGDIKWVRQNVGELTNDQLSYLLHRLECEVW